jgi:hypothetical protein
MNNLTAIAINMSNNANNTLQIHVGQFVAFTTIYVFIGLIALIGNSLVLYAAWRTKNLGTLRYFDSAIKSLAVADMLFGLIAIPLRMVYIGKRFNILNTTYITIDICNYTGHNPFKGTEGNSSDLGVIRYLLMFPSHVLEYSSILHVSLLVFLRLITLRNPLGFQGQDIRRFRHVAISVIWIMSITVVLLDIIARCQEMDDFSMYLNLVNLHCFKTIPVVGIVLMYGSLLWTVKRQQKQTNTIALSTNTSNREARNRRMTAMVSRVVICLLICYLPYLASKHYFAVTDLKTSLEKQSFKVNIFTSTIGFSLLPAHFGKTFDCDEWNYKFIQ